MACACPHPPEEEEEEEEERERGRGGESQAPTRYAGRGGNKEDKRPLELLAVEMLVPHMANQGMGQKRTTTRPPRGLQLQLRAPRRVKGSDKRPHLEASEPGEHDGPVFANVLIGDRVSLL